MSEKRANYRIALYKGKKEQLLIFKKSSMMMIKNEQEKSK